VTKVLDTRRQDREHKPGRAGAFKRGTDVSSRNGSSLYGTFARIWTSAMPR